MADQKRFKIYTRTGDKGTSALFTGERRPKDDAVFEALGTVDELSSYLGLAREYCEDAKNGLPSKLEKIQCVLQDVGSNVATPRGSASEFKLARTEFDVDGSLVAELENWIDELDTNLEPLKNFILPASIGFPMASDVLCNNHSQEENQLLLFMLPEAFAAQLSER
ncbi:hypothetical protein HDU82_004137 [Entophlyctis luteolus]|nr:hypothetical protein HDU82_004137 [Entophlyctis luteolus]